MPAALPLWRISLPPLGDFVKLSGNFLNRTALENKRGTPLNDDDKDRRRLLLEKLRELEKATGDSAGNFYALLLMDGDRMGRAHPRAHCQSCDALLDGVRVESR